MEGLEINPLEEKILKPLRWIVSILQRHHIPFQITGGLATRLYGGQREVFDIDLDIPEERFEEILQEVAPYITFGPSLHADESWRVYLLTLNYEGQAIDLGGAYQTQIFDPSTEQWVPSPANLENVRMVSLSGLSLPVVNAEDLLHYKEILSRPVDLQDIQVIRAWVLTQIPSFGE